MIIKSIISFRIRCNIMSHVFVFQREGIHHLTNPIKRNHLICHFFSPCIPSAPKTWLIHCPRPKMPHSTESQHSTIQHSHLLTISKASLRIRACKIQKHVFFIYHSIFFARSFLICLQKHTVPRAEHFHIFVGNMCR